MALRANQQGSSTGEVNALDAAIGTSDRETSFLGYLREWLDALIIAFVLAMFIRTFVVELFKIPSGSMSPTLLGDVIAEGNAFDREGKPGFFLLVVNRQKPEVQIFRKDDEGHYRYEGQHPLHLLTDSQSLMLHREQHLEEHRIFVNKFAYWFKPPERGDIIVFRVPFKLNPRPDEGYLRNGVRFNAQEYRRSQSVYVKRCVGLPGERIQIQDGQLLVNGEPVKDSPAIARTTYNTTEVTPTYDVMVPEGTVLAFGDNSDNSADSRYWGPLPMENLRGKAFLRYWPWRKIRFLNE